MLFNLAEQNQAPTSLKKVSKSGVPSLAIVLSAAALLIGVILNYLVPEKVFTWVTSISTFGAIWTWAMILLSQLKYRKNLSVEEKAKIKFKAPFWPYGSYIALAFLIMVVILMGFFPDTRIALIVGPLWLLLLVAVYYGKGMNKQ